MMKFTGTNQITFQKLDWEELKTNLTRISDLDELGMPFPWSRDSWMSLEKTWNQYFLICGHDANQVQSFALWHISDIECAHLLKVVVNPNERGRGQGGQLLRHCLETLSLRQFKTCYLEVGIKNLAAINLYEGLGFKKLREVKGFYSDGSNAYAMQLILN